MPVRNSIILTLKGINTFRSLETESSLTAENKTSMTSLLTKRRHPDNTQPALKRYAKDGTRVDRMENFLFVLFCRLYRNNECINGR